MTTEFKWNFGIDEYKRLFHKTRESTACGPSGLHVSHWVAGADYDPIAEVHAFFIMAAFKLGITYDFFTCSASDTAIKRVKQIK